MNKIRNWFAMVTMIVGSISASSLTTGCLMGGDEKTPPAETGGTSGNQECNPGTHSACDCSSTLVNGTKTCSSSGTWGSCENCVSNECTPNATVSCSCSATMINGTKTCSSSGTWGQCISCVNTDNDGDGYVSTQYGGKDCNDNNAAIHPGATEVCNQVDDNCDGNVDEGGVCICSSGQTSACDCSSTSVNGIKTCQSNGSWGACGSCTAVTECTPNSTASCDCSSTMKNGTKTCSSSGYWGACGSCTATNTGPTPCASMTGVTSWKTVVLVVNTTETSTVQFQGMCGNYDSSTKKWTGSSDYTVIPGCEAVSVSNGTATCTTKMPANFNTFEGNNYLNNGYWSVGVLTDGVAREVCPSSFNASTNTCTDLWSVMSKHGDYSIAGTACLTSMWVINGNNNSFNCRVTVN